MPSQFEFSHSGDKVFIRPNNMPDSVPHFFFRKIIPVGDAQKSSEASHVCYVACIFLSNSAVWVHILKAYKKIEMTKEHLIPILELRAMFLSFDMVLSFDNAPTVWAILDRVSCFDPSSVITRRMVQDNNWSQTRMSAFTYSFQHLP